MRLFFWMAHHGEFDGAAAEGLAEDLANVFRSTGDAKFAGLLSGESKETRQSVIGYLEFGLGDLSKFPETSKLDS